MAREGGKPCENLNAWGEAGPATKKRGVRKSRQRGERRSGQEREALKRRGAWE